MDLAEGFQVTDPPVLVPWSAVPSDIPVLFPDLEVQAVATRYLTVGGTVLLGQLDDLCLGLHFDEHGVERFELAEVNPARRATPAFHRHQTALEAVFGPPSWRGEEWSGYGEGPARDFVWDVSGGLVLHRLFHRFVFEEHLWMLRLGTDIPYGDPRERS